MRKILISGCLYHEYPIRYNNTSAKIRDPRFNKWDAEGRFIPFCPEVYAGLPIPRPAATRIGGRIMEENGNDATEAYTRGAEEAVRLAKEHDVLCCIMMEYSPSCASKIIENETRSFDIPGEGLTTEYLRKAGFKIFSQYDLPAVEAYIKEHDQ